MIDTPTYIIPGERITSLEKFYDIIAEVLHFPTYFGKNLDALDDCLYGDEEPPRKYILKWNNSTKSRELLGYPETIRQLEKRLHHCHPDNRESVAKDLEQAKAHKGQTVFDWLVEIITDHENIELQLD